MRNLKEDTVPFEDTRVQHGKGIIREDGLANGRGGSIVFVHLQGRCSSTRRLATDATTGTTRDTLLRAGVVLLKKETQPSRVEWPVH